MKKEQEMNHLLEDDPEFYMYNFFGKMQKENTFKTFQELSNKIILLITKRYSPDDTDNELINGIGDSINHYSHDKLYKNLINSFNQEEILIFTTILFGILRKA